MALSEGKSILTKKAVGIGVGAVAVVGAAVGIILSLNGQQAFRNISVLEVIGQAKVNRTTENVEYDAYANMNLQSGDDIRVFEESELDLKLDDDKFVCAEANTHFWLEAEGTSEDSKTVIRMDEGASFHEINNKLSENSSYEIETPTSTMAIRGTVVRSEILENGYTKCMVFEGSAEVYTHPVGGELDGESLNLNGGYQCITRGDSEYAEFVMQDYEGSQEEAIPIDYSELSLETLNHIKEVTVEGREAYSGDNVVELEHIEMFIEDVEGGMPEEDRPVYYMEDLTPVYEKTWKEDKGIAVKPTKEVEPTKKPTPTVAPTPTDKPEPTKKLLPTESVVASESVNEIVTPSVAVLPEVVSPTPLSEVTPAASSETTDEITATPTPTEDEITPTPTDAVSCTVTFNYNGVFATQTVNSGNTASSPKLIPTSKGHWAVDSTGSTPFDFSLEITEDITIYWIAE